MAEWRVCLSALTWAFLLLLLYSQLVLVLNPGDSFFVERHNDKRLNLTLAYMKPKYVPNTNFTKKHTKPERFTMNGSKKVLDMSRSVLTIPSILGYPPKQGRKVFPYYRYPSCQRRNPPPRGFVKLDYKQNRLFMRCPGPFKGKYVLGPFKEKRFTDYVQLARKWVVHPYKAPVKIGKHVDFVIASCKRDSRRFELFQHIPRFDSKIKKRAIDTTKKIQGKTGVMRKPMIIAMITVDSFSRNHFFRKLRKTVKYMNKLEKRKTWKVTDFKMHNIIGPDTVENQAEVFATGYEGYNPDKIGTDQVGSSALWRVLSNKGFVTMLGVEACAYKMYYWVGDNPRADHVSNSFFCANYRFAGYTAEKKSTPHQRCIGSHMSHYYLMNYTLDFMSKYEGTNRWAYNHLTAAHEQSGQHAQTLDKDLVWYVKSMIKRFSAKNDLVIFLMADHGMRYGNFKTGKYAIQEHRLPAFFLLTKRSFLNKMEFSYDTLSHNTLRLTSKPDVRRTVLHLANYTLGLGLSKRKDKAVSLFSEKVENSRRCEDVGIPPWYCSAYVLETIETRVYNETHPKASANTQTEKHLGKLLRDVAGQIMYILNSRIYTIPQMGKGTLCKRLTLRKILIASYSSLSNGNILFKLTLQTRQISAGRFESFVMLSDHPESIPSVGQDQYPSFPVQYAGRKMMGRIVMVNRSDKYGGICEEVARSYKVNPEHCVCRDEAVQEFLTQKHAKKPNTSGKVKGKVGKKNKGKKKGKGKRKGRAKSKRQRK